jgi:hypothetical protein
MSGDDFHAVGAAGIGCTFRWLLSGTRMSALTKEPRPLLPIPDYSGGTQTYVRGQIAAEEQKKFGKELALSRTAS